MTEQEVLEALEKTGAVLTNSHFVYASGEHGPDYVNKDALYPHTEMASRIGLAIAERFVNQDIDVVVGPEKGGIILSQWVAYHLSQLTERKVLSVYAEKGAEDNFVLKRGYDKLIYGKKVLVVEDVLTTGGSGRQVVAAVRACGGKVEACHAICNRGGVKVTDIGVPVYALVDISLDTYEEESCPLCTKGKPLVLNIGKGLEFLNRRSDKYLLCPNPKCNGLAHYIKKDEGTYACPKCGSTELFQRV